MVTTSFRFLQLVLHPRLRLGSDHVTHLFSLSFIHTRFTETGKTQLVLTPCHPPAPPIAGTVSDRGGPWCGAKPGSGLHLNFTTPYISTKLLSFIKLLSDPDLLSASKLFFVSLTFAAALFIIAKT